MNLLSSDDRALLERHLEQLLTRSFGDSAAGPLNQCVQAYVLAGGKRLRPQLSLWTYQQLRDEPGAPLPSAVLDIACVWELFHAFLLAHDDVIDNADTRRDQPSLHRQLAELDSGSLTFGRNLAIVAGDLLFSAAMRLLADIDLPGDAYRKIQKLFTRIACTTGLGQVLDICQSHARLDDVQEQTLLNEYDWKTAAYTFEGPMLSGAILAGAHLSTQEAISRFAVSIGQAYQLHNDLADLDQPVHDGCDLVQGKRTITLMRARAAMPADQQRAFDQRFLALQHGGGASLVLAESLRQELHDCGGVRATQQLIEQCLASARGVATDPSHCARLRNAIGGLLDSLQTRYFARV